MFVVFPRRVEDRLTKLNYLFILIMIFTTEVASIYILTIITRKNNIIIIKDT